MTCAVEGTVKLPKSVDAVDGEYQYTFVADDQCRLSAIVLVAPVDRPDRFWSAVVPPSGDEVATITIEMDDDLTSAMKSRLQALESHLAFRLPIERIRWDSAHFEVLSETPEERRRQPALSIQVDLASARRDDVEATDRQLRVAVGACTRFPDLTPYLAFIREGNNDFFRFRFINAFYNFYFVLEGLFSGGRWRNHEVASAFVQSESFPKIVEACLRFMREERMLLYERLLTEIGSTTASPTVEDVATFLVKQRGALHHFSNPTAERSPTPFAHDLVAPACHLIRCLAVRAVTEQMVNVIRREGVA